MNLINKEKLDTVSVFELMNENFYIPDYQRGYRWTKSEVSKLISDLDDFFYKNNDSNTFYCMQPLVVFYNKAVKAWEVVDGQQRLTTLFLILREIREKRDNLKEDYSDMKLFTLSYQSRPDSADYIDTIDENRKNENIDYYHMYNASQTINRMLPQLKSSLEQFVDAIINIKDNKNVPSVKFIWYNITEEVENAGISPEEKFSDLNIGKIGLTNAELVKALLLNNISDNESEALRIAYEWDDIEHALQDDKFWSFIYGKNDTKYATRIEFLFDIIKSKKSDEQNEYYTFDKYSEDIKNIDDSDKGTIVKKLWKDIVNKYYLFKGWYYDRNLYHIIGYLRFLKTDIIEIEKIYLSKETKDTDVFFNILKKTAIERTIKSDCDISALSCSDDKKTVYNVLMLFNILSILRCEKSNVRFSFDEFYKHSWDIEHVRSQTPKDLAGNSRKDWIVCNIEYFTGINYNNYHNIENSMSKYKEAIDSAPNSNIIFYKDKTVADVCNQLYNLLNIKSDITESEVYNLLHDYFNQREDFKYEDNIGNLVLLDQGTNRGYKNAYFPVKRQWINRRQKEGIYILPCTRDVFSKNYTTTLFDLMNWNNEDAEAYVDEIKRVIKYE